MHYRALALPTLGFAALSALAAVAVTACSSTDAPQSSLPSGGSGGSAAGSTSGPVGGGGTGIVTGGSATGGTVAVGTSGNAGTFATGGTAGGSAGASGSATGGGGASGSGGAAAGTGGGGGSGGGGPGKVPTCLTNDVTGGVNRSDNNYIECDVEDQAIDFDVATAYKPPRKPGYDPATTPVTLTDYGTAFTGSAVQECHPYCYRGNLTLGLDLIAGSDTSLRGEVLFGFPPTVAPIADPKGRASLGWVFVDGPPLPAGTTISLTMVLKSMDKGIVLATMPKTAALKTWVEFRYFPIDSGFAAADLVNITHIGFRIALTPTAAAADWHGVVYADHFQLRK
ncbi:MAG TPA: hypothetical protein VNG33_11475 [Polyangiaceae bacterium]|nr:hypothetical protein [Polyangiaceae bacterium]